MVVPLVAKAIERPTEPEIYLSSPDTVLDPKVLAQEQIEANPEVIRHLVEQTFYDVPVMLKIAYCESGTVTPTDCIGPINPTAKNPSSTAKGVFQILDGTWRAYGCVGDVLNARDNIACARKIYDKEGTRPWNASSYHWSQ